MTEAINHAYYYQNPVCFSSGYNPQVDVLEKSIFLEEKLEKISDKQGFLGDFWNGIKEFTTLGVSESDCEKMLDKYKSGEISFEEAVEYLEEYNTKQSNGSALVSNILTGVGAIATATVAAASGPIGWGLAIAKGAPIGAALKTGINMLDRATNEVEGDEFNAKQIIKDAVSGAMTGATSAVASGVGAGITSGNVMLSIKNGAKCGAICGGASGALSYTTDAILEEDIDFNLGDLAENSLTSAFVSGTVGAVVGGGMYGAATKGIGGTIGEVSKKSLTQTIVQDSTTSSLRKALGSAERLALGL